VPDDLDVRIPADDLTGALDGAVAFAAPGRGIGVSRRPGVAHGRRNPSTASLTISKSGAFGDTELLIRFCSILRKSDQL
jgi:uncharacterized protein YgbK (DUF1537 family)